MGRASVFGLGALVVLSGCSSAGTGQVSEVANAFYRAVAEDDGATAWPSSTRGGGSSR